MVQRHGLDTQHAAQLAHAELIDALLVNQRQGDLGDAIAVQWFGLGFGALLISCH
jgi:hypothetical protein